MSATNEPTTTDTSAASSAHPVRTLAATPAAAVEPERVTWLIPEWLPDRSITLLAGREGIGKSTVAADIAAQATRGDWGGEAMRVLYIAMEDSRAMVTVPRLIAAGADMDRVDFLDVHQAGLPGALDLPRDLDALASLVADGGHGLVVLDPVTAVMSPRLNPNHAADVRRVLDPLARMADHSGCAVLAVSHFGKAVTADTGRAVLGSSAWSQVPRSVLAVAADDTNGGIIVTNTKTNLGAAVVSRSATVTTGHVDVPGTPMPAAVGRIEWHGITDRDARDLMDADTDTPRAVRTNVDRWLREQLNDGAAWTRDLYTDATGAGFTKDQLRGAKTRLNVRANKVGTAGWAWYLPGTSDTPADAANTRSAHGSGAPGLVG